MMPFIGCWCLSLVVCSGEVSRAAAPPVAGAMRTVSLAEAATRALEHKGYQVERSDDGSLRVAHASRIDPLEAERFANQTLLNVEVAYWNLYRSRMALAGRKQGLRRSRALLRVCESRHEIGKATRTEVTQARSQYESMRAQSQDASQEEAESERQLASMIGMGLRERVRLQPCDTPTLAPSRPDWDASLRHALSRRPELRTSRNEVSYSKAMLLTERAVEALSGLPCEQLWTLMAMGRNTPTAWRSPIGDISPKALQAQVAFASQVLEDQEGKAHNFLELYYRRISLNYEQIQATRAQREAFGELLRARNVEYAAGRGTLAALLEANRNCNDARAQEYAAIGSYNNALAGFEYGKGTILDRHHMVFATAGGDGAK